MTSDAARPPLLAVEALSKHFPGVEALSAVSLTVLPGEVHGLVGQNGAGKSTLVKCIAGVHPPDRGRILFDGRPITTYTPKHAYDLGIAVLHQRAQLLPWLSVAENVLLGQLPSRAGVVIDRHEANRRTRDLLAQFRLDIDPAVPVAHLTTPERQQVAIAKAVYRRAKLLILDEPTAALDAERSERLFTLVGQLVNEGVAILYVTHPLEEIFRLADRLTVLRDGRLMVTCPTREVTQTEVVTLMAGRAPAAAAAPPTAPAVKAEPNGPALLAVEHLRTDVLRDVSLEVRTGEVVGVTGVIGAGGHEVARVIYGLDRPTAGRIRLAGHPYRPRGPRQSIGRHIFLVPEDPDRQGLVLPLSVAANITLVALRAITRHGVLSLPRERAVAQQFRRDLNIAAPSLATPVRTLSGGNRQKVLLAKGLAADAAVLVLEEPTQGVDVSAKVEIHRIVRELAAAGRAVLVISTDVRDLLRFVDRIVCLRSGEVVQTVSARETSYAEIIAMTVGSLGAQAS